MNQSPSKPIQFGKQPPRVAQLGRNPTPFQFELQSLFGLTTRVAVATTLVKTFGGIALVAFLAFVAIIPEVFFTLVILSVLTGVLVLPYAIWLLLQRIADGFRALRELVNR